MRLAVLDPATDVHTSDLTEPCARKVYLKWQGNISGEVQTAMLRGSIAGRACDLIVMHGVDPERAASMAAPEVVSEYTAKNMILSDAAARNIPDIVEEVGGAMVRIPEVLSMLGDGGPVGCELPVRGTMVVEGVTQSVASHLDFLWKRTDGTRVVVDWKWREESPTQAFLARNMQMALYWWLASNEGIVQLPSGEWKRMVGHAKVAWINLPGLLPVKKAQTIVDKYTGEVFDLKKGDLRPIEKAIRWCNFDESQMKAVEREIGARIAMYREGLYPMSPDEKGCHFCECERWCPRFDVSN